MRKAKGITLRILSFLVLSVDSLIRNLHSFYIFTSLSVLYSLVSGED